MNLVSLLLTIGEPFLRYKHHGRRNTGIADIGHFSQLLLSFVILGQG